MVSPAAPLLRRSLAVACLALVVAGGCMALPGPRLLFEDPRLDPKGTVPLRAALMPLRDARPPVQDDRSGFRRTFDEKVVPLLDGGHQFQQIERLPEQVTAVLLSDFSDARLFSSIAFASDAGQADVLLRGDIRALTWKPRHDPWPYVPALAFLAELGEPVAWTVSAVEIALEVANPKTDQVLGSYTGAGREQRAYTLYTPQYRAAGDGPFRHASQQLQDAILADRDRLVAAVKPTG